jgi:hypothetical protein
MSELSELVPELKSALDAIEMELAEEDVSPLVLEDFKVTVDSVRTSVLALLTAKDSGDYYGFVRKYRLRRAAQVCQNVLSGLIDKTINADTPGLDQLHATVDETLERLEQLY